MKKAESARARPSVISGLAAAACGSDTAARAKGTARTLAFYAHYDGQPADTLSWRGLPWTPVLRDAACSLLCGVGDFLRLGASGLTGRPAVISGPAGAGEPFR